MLTDLIIGMASGYTWEDLEPFAVSLRRTGYNGMCYLITGDGPKDGVPRYGELPPARTDRTLDQMLAKYQIFLKDVGPFDEHPSIIRGKYVAEIVGQATILRYVLCVDTKDVVFQSDPMTWFQQKLGTHDIAVVSEMQKYGDGPMVGNNKNMVEAFGTEEYEKLRGKDIVNGGVFGGRASSVALLCANIHALSLMDRRRRPDFKPSYADMLPDQSALNILIREWDSNRIFITCPSDGFAFGHPLTRYSTFKNGVMYPSSFGPLTKPYMIFHQYFDKPEWWREVRSKYKS